MSVGPTRGPVQRPSDDRDFTEIFQRVDDLERGQPAGGFPSFNVGLFLNQAGPDVLGVQQKVVASPQIIAVGGFFAALSATWYIPAGGIIAVGVQNYDSAAHDVLLTNGFVQEIGATTREAYSGNVISMPALGSATLTWDTHVADSVILDNTDPEHPTVGVSAVYAVSVLIGINPSPG